MDTSDPIISSISIISRLNKKKLSLFLKRPLHLLAIQEKEPESSFVANTDIDIVHEDNIEILQRIVLDSMTLSDEESHKEEEI